MLKQFDETIRDYLTGVSRKGNTVKSYSDALKILYDVQRVRNTDYIIYFDSVGTLQAQLKEVVTRANWFFILTNAACWFDVPIKDFPKIGVKFYDVKPNSPYRADDVPGAPVLAKLTFGRETESNKHFEEYKNIFFALGQRIAVDLTLEPTTTAPIRGAVLLSGIEVNLFKGA